MPRAHNLTDEQKALVLKMISEFASYKEIIREAEVSMAYILKIKRGLGLIGEPIRRSKTSAASCHAQSLSEDAPEPLPSPELCELHESFQSRS